VPIPEKHPRRLLLILTTALILTSSAGAFAGDMRCRVLSTLLDVINAAPYQASTGPDTGDLAKEQTDIVRRIAIARHTLDRAAATGAIDAGEAHLYRTIIQSHERHAPHRLDTVADLGLAAQHVNTTWMQSCWPEDDQVEAEASEPRNDPSGTWPDETVAGTRSANGDQNNHSVWRNLNFRYEAATFLKVAFTLILLAAGHRALKKFLYMRAQRMKRRTNRYVCNFATNFFCASGELPVQIVDLSVLGCKLKVGVEIPIQSHCELKVLGKAIPSKVVWSNRWYCGIAFLEELDEAQLRLVVMRQSTKNPVLLQEKTRRGET
jgi:hypothetical protein